MRRKINVVMRYHKSSYLVGRELAAAGQVLDEARGAKPIDHCAAWGLLPDPAAWWRRVGSVTVSGIPQRQDHAFVAEAVARHLGQDYAELALPVQER